MSVALRSADIPVLPEGVPSFQATPVLEKSSFVVTSATPGSWRLIGFIHNIRRSSAYRDDHAIVCAFLRNHITLRKHLRAHMGQDDASRC